VTNNERRRNKEAAEMVAAVAVENGLSMRCTIIGGYRKGARRRYI